MASSNIKLFNENKGNMLNDTEFNISTQRLNGLQTGVASSQLQNKAMYQASLIAYAIAQVMMQNGKNANDTDAVSAFVANLSGTMLQKVYDIATTAEAQAGAATGKWMSPALVKAAIDTLAAKASNILSDTTKALLGLTSDATPDDAFKVLARSVRIDRLVVEKIYKSRNWIAPKAVGQLFKVYASGGGGGGGGGYSSSSSSSGAGGAGGGGGGHVEIQTFTIQEGTSINVVCGAGGAGGAGSTDSSKTTNGGDGGTTTFGTLLTATGGKGGESGTSGTGGAGGAGGGAGSYRGNGGNGDQFGGGGCGTNSKAVGGNGGMYGGGGGAAVPGQGGTYGGNGASGENAGSDGTCLQVDLIDILLMPELLHPPFGGVKYGGGGGMYGSGGTADVVASFSASKGYGGGGGFCANGGNCVGGAGGGGGGYCGDGGNGSKGGGGGGGLFAKGGDGGSNDSPRPNGGGGAGLTAGGNSKGTEGGGDGGVGGVIIVYFKDE